MNILILNWRDPKNPKAGGAEIVTLEHAKYYVKMGHKVTWFTSMFKGANALEKIDGVTIVRSGGSFSVYLKAPFYYLKHRKNVDVVIDEIHGIPFLTPLYVHKPKIAFIHEVANEIWDYMYPFPINKLGKFFESFYFMFYRSVPFWTDADSTIDDLVTHGIPVKNCTAINCPTHVKALTKLPQKEKVPTFIFVSRVVKMKGIENVIQAFKRIHADLPDAKLWIVGGGESKYIDYLKKLVESFSLDKSVSFKGRVSEKEKIDLLRRAHLILHASVKEGWGIVIIEAASQATPAVVYDVAGLRDSVKDGKTGIVLSENSPDEMAEQAVKLIKSQKRYRQMQENALVLVNSLRWGGMTEKSLQLLNSL